jgi:hypothetical protein
MAAPLADLNPYSVISIASIAIALLTFVSSLIFNRRDEGHSYLERSEERTRDLQRQIEKLEKDLLYCRNRVDDLLKENLILLRKMANLNGEDKLPKGESDIH